MIRPNPGPGLGGGSAGTKTRRLPRTEAPGIMAGQCPCPQRPVRMADYAGQLASPPRVAALLALLLGLLLPSSSSASCGDYASYTPAAGVTPSDPPRPEPARPCHG